MVSSPNDPTAEELARRALMVEMVRKRAMEHPLVLEILADCAAAFDTENQAMHDSEVDGPYDGSRLKNYESQLRAEAKRIRTEDPDIWPQDKFSLEQIAHFDRCLFPDSFEEDLIQTGLDRTEAAILRQILIGRRLDGGQCSVVDLYQEFIDVPAITLALERVLEEFVQKPS